MSIEWSELEEQCDRAFPRLEAKYGACPICHRGATFVFTIHGVQWSICDACLTCWSPGSDLLDGDHDEATLAFLYAELAHYDPLPSREAGARSSTTVSAGVPATPRQRRSLLMPPSETTAAISGKDPWPLVRIPDDARTYDAPAHWYLLTRADRDRMGQLIELFFAAGGQIPVQTLLRAHYETVDGFGLERSKAAAVAQLRLFIEDPTERAAWKLLHHTLASSPLDRTLDRAVELIRQDLNQIDALRAKLARLEAVRGRLPVAR